MSDMDGCYGQFGWREFHRNRKNILAEFDRIAELTLNRPVRAAHGTGVEAYLRQWLSEFLPAKFKVTSGYVIPNLYDDAAKLYHYDIIIYDALASPVLWTEGNEDTSSQGRFRAIPAQHVVAIYEVKARLTKNSVSEALEKLRQTRGFADQLHQHYTCGAIFIELKCSDTNKSAILAELSSGKDVQGFSGGMVLRYEDDHSITGLIVHHNQDTSERKDSGHHTPLAKTIDEVSIFMTEDGNLHLAERGAGCRLVKTSTNNWSVTKSYSVMHDDGNSSLRLSWSRSNFSEFCIDLIRRLEGLPYNDRRRPSFGMVFDSVHMRPAKTQSTQPGPGEPHLNLALHAGDAGAMMESRWDLEPPTIQFWVRAENLGEYQLRLSDNGFKSDCELPAKCSAITSVVLEVVEPLTAALAKEQICGDGLRFPYRVVYVHGQDEKEYFSVEKTVQIKDDEISFV